MGCRDAWHSQLESFDCFELNACSRTADKRDQGPGLHEGGRIGNLADEVYSGPCLDQVGRGASCNGDGNILRQKRLDFMQEPLKADPVRMPCPGADQCKVVFNRPILRDLHAPGGHEGQGYKMVLIEAEGRTIILREGEDEARLLAEPCFKPFQDAGFTLEQKFLDVACVLRIFLSRTMFDIVRDKEAGFVLEDIHKGASQGHAIQNIGIELAKLADGFTQFLLRDDTQFGGRYCQPRQERLENPANLAL